MDGASRHHRDRDEGKRSPRAALEPLVTSQPAGPSRLELVQNAIMAPFNHRRNHSTKILSDLAPVIMTPKMINHTAAAHARAQPSLIGQVTNPRMDFATLGRAPLRMSLGRRITSGDLQIVEATDALLEEEIPEVGGVASDVSLLKGFNATIPSSEQNKTRRRQLRHVDAPRMGLKRLGMNARGMMTADEDDERQSAASEDDVVIVPRAGKKRRGRESLSASKVLGKEELTRQSREIIRDKENLHVRRSLINNEITEITHKIEALDLLRQQLEGDVIRLQEEELELDDELEGVKERLDFEQQKAGTSGKSGKHPRASSSHASRRRKGPAFLPSEHEELPQGVAFMTLESHITPITSLDFSEPYGTLVSASQDDSQPRVWDLFSGTEIGRLRGHHGSVKCLQVEDQICLTGGDDGDVRLWDLNQVEAPEEWGGEMVNLSDVVEEEESQGSERDSENFEKPNGIRHAEAESSKPQTPPDSSACARVLQGHTKAVTSLYFEDQCLVTGASDKTLRQWDLTTGQCVMTMDILWAISHPQNLGSGSLLPGAAAAAGTFAVPTPPYADGSWEMYEDFVGGLQFWGYGLVSGSGDGAVRMWDMRTGQAHRTLLGHTGPVTCLQFDEIHVATGSLDKTLRIWDLRTGGTFETLTYDHAVTGLQFDSRKVIAAAGENGIKVYNRTSMQHSTLSTAGHTKPVERLRFMDRYMVSGGRDATVKIWSL